MVTTALSPLARLPNAHVTTVAPLQLPLLDTRDMMVNPLAGSECVSVAFVAVMLPILVTVVVKTSGLPTVAGNGVADRVTLKSPAMATGVRRKCFT